MAGVNSLSARPFASSSLFTPWRLSFFLVLVAAFAVYIPSLSGAPLWDDETLLNGTGIGGGASVIDALTKPFIATYYRPLVSLSFFYENALWHGNPFYYHLSNVLLHVLTCAALIGFVLALFGSRRLAILSGFLFALQPAQVSAVAWIGGRTDSLCALLTIIFVYALVLGLGSRGAKQCVWIAVSAIAFFCAALTKEQIVALILLVPIAIKLFSPPDKDRGARFYATICAPYVALGILYVFLWLRYNPNPYHPLMRGVPAQFAMAGQTSLYYALLYLLPSGKWMHTFTLETMRHIGPAAVGGGMLILLALLYGLWLLWRQNKNLAWVATISALVMLPVLNLIPLPSLLVAPYRAGVGGLGVAVLLAYFFLRTDRANIHHLIGVAFTCWCAWLCYWGATQWKDPVTLFTRITIEDPGSLIARRNLSLYLMRADRTPEAVQQIATALDELYGSENWRDPRQAFLQFQNDKSIGARILENQGNMSDPSLWLGQMMAQLGFEEGKIHDFDNSRKQFAAAVLFDPDNAKARVGLAQFAMIDKRPQVALIQIRQAIEEGDSDPDSYALEARIEMQLKRPDLAENSYKNAIAIQPTFGPSYQFLAEAQAAQGHTEDAINSLKRALDCRDVDPNVINDRIRKLQDQLNVAKS